MPTRSGALLTIIPHGPLFGLPFSALRDAKGRYLIEQFSTHYVPSAAVLKFTAENQKVARADSTAFVVVADGLPRMVDGKTLPPLNTLSQEVSSILQAFPQQSFVVRRDDAAKSSVVADDLKTARVAHFAAHAVLSNHDPLSSFIALAPDPGNPDLEFASGKLTVGKIYDLHIPAELVVLSACDTASGKVSSDGVAGMSRAFFSAGAASVIASMWDVPDAPTAFTMRAFYRTALHEQDLAHSLRSAQLDLLKALRAHRLKVRSPAGDLVLPEDPHLWAGFVLEGNP